MTDLVSATPSSVSSEVQFGCHPGGYQRQDLTRRRFGKLTVTGIAHFTETGRAMWACACECGGYAEASSRELKEGKKTCGCGGRKELAGKRFGTLTVIEYSGRAYTGTGRPNGAEWRCRCDCGEELRVLSSRLTTGGVKQCNKCREANKKKSAALRQREKIREAMDKKAKQHLAYILGEDDLALLKIGRRFGKLVVKSMSWESKSAKCDCDCGGATEVSALDLIWGRELSCGCEDVEELIYGVLTGEHIKIGVSTKFWHRMQAIHVGSPFDVEVLCLLPNGTPQKEMRIHKMLKEYRTHGEWFSEEDFILDALTSSRDADDLVEKVKEAAQ